MYEHWTQDQRDRATDWVSTEHEGAPPDTSRVLVHTREFYDPRADYATGYYHQSDDKWFIQGWAGVRTFDGYKGIAYWRRLPGREAEPLTQRVRELEAALRFYAIRDNWTARTERLYCKAMTDRGERARVALRQGQGAGEKEE